MGEPQAEPVAPAAFDDFTRDFANNIGRPRTWAANKFGPQRGPVRQG